MSEQWMVLFNGTDDAPLGRLLSPPTIPDTPRPRYVPEPLIAPPPTKIPRPRQNAQNRRGGVVYHAHDAIWTLLEFPRSTLEIVAVLALPRNATSSALNQGYHAGILVRAGHRKNEPARKGQPTWSRLYQRAPEYASSLTWPYISQTRAERRAQAQR